MNSVVNKLKASLFEREMEGNCHKCKWNCNCSSIDKKVDAMLGKHVLFDLDVGMLVCLLDQIRIKDQFKKVTKKVTNMVHGIGNHVEESCSFLDTNENEDLGGPSCSSPHFISAGKSRAIAFRSRRQSQVMETDMSAYVEGDMPTLEGGQQDDEEFHNVEMEETATFLDAVLNHQQRALDEIMKTQVEEVCHHVDESCVLLDEREEQKNHEVEESIPLHDVSELEHKWQSVDGDLNANVADHDVKDLKHFVLIRKISEIKRPRSEWEQMMADVKAVHRHSDVRHLCVPPGH